MGTTSRTRASRNPLFDDERMDDSESDEVILGKEGGAKSSR